MSDIVETKNEKELKTLKEVKSIILRLKRISEELNLSNNQIRMLFQENGFEFWRQNGMEEMMEELGLQSCLVPGEPVDISNDSLAILRAQIDEDVRQTEASLNEGVVMLMKGPSIY